jgi:hypothetical protein
MTITIYNCSTSSRESRTPYLRHTARAITPQRLPDLADERAFVVVHVRRSWTGQYGPR